MNECALTRASLEDAALGTELSDALRLHLATCGDCGAELERRRAIVRRLDALITARANAQLPSDLDVRVLSHVRRAEPRQIRSRSAWPAAAAFVLVIAVVALFARTALTPVPHPGPLVSWQSPTAALLQPVR